tara:strand:- start:383 stop:664 length:282 start_codon:yes stop_codon:yes gene_type:complete
MKDKLSRVELTQMLLDIETARETNLKLIEMLEDSLKGMGGTMRENRIIWKQEIAELKEAMSEQDKIRKRLFFEYAINTISLDDIKAKLKTLKQ